MTSSGKKREIADGSPDGSANGTQYQQFKMTEAEGTNQAQPNEAYQIIHNEGSTKNIPLFFKNMTQGRNSALGHTNEGTGTDSMRATGYRGALGGHGFYRNTEPYKPVIAEIKQKFP